MPILGLRGTGNFAANEVPENWREGILFYYPNGETPLIALSSQGKSEATDNYRFHWWDKSLPSRRLFVNNAAGYSAAATSIVVDDGAGGSAAALVHAGVVLMNERTFERMIVTANPSGDSITVARGKGATAAAAMNNDDALLVIGTAYEDGATAVSGLSFDPVERVNVCQIFQRGVGPLTRRMAKTTLRTGDKFMDMKHDAWLNIALDMEWSALFGDFLDEAGSSGAVRRTFSGGLYYWVKTNNFDGGGAVSYFSFLDMLENQFRYGSSEKLLLAGSTALLVINKIAKLEMTMNTVPGEDSFGMKIFEVICPFGVFYLKNHPLLSDHPVFRTWMFGIDLEYFVMRYIDDITYIPHADVSNPHRRQDEYYADVGWEWQVERTHGVYRNFVTAV
jgi:hypothetical protein